MLKVNLRNSYPRCYVTRQIRADEGFYFGPFASRRLAEDFSAGFLDLFKTRRCQIKIRRDPDYPGCIYSQMKMCLAPCFAGCTKEEYDVEVGHVLEALASQGAALTVRLEREREAASEALEFEHAAGLHKRIEKASQALRGLPDIARRVEELDAVILQRGAEEKSIAVFALHAGILAEPFYLRFAEVSEPRSVESVLRAAFEPLSNATSIPNQLNDAAVAATEQESAEKMPTGGAPLQANLAETSRLRYGLREAPSFLTEHLSLVSRWFYSKPREGEILFRKGDWPYRRILRACARLLNPQEENPPPSSLPQS